MKIVIDIDDMAYKFVQNTSFVEDESVMFKQTNADRKKTLFLFNILDAIKNGTLLPKGHGRLIDADAFIARLEDASKRQKYKKLLIDDCLTVDDVFKAIIESLQNKGLANGDTPTIIEADTDKAESNLDGDPIDIDKAVEHYEGTLEVLKGIDLEVDV